MPLIKAPTVDAQLCQSNGQGCAVLQRSTSVERSRLPWHTCSGLMKPQRAHVVLPQALIEEIDALVGPRGRSAFLVETAKAELNRRQLLAFLRSDEPAWRDEDHPELAGGVAEWVHTMRQESERRSDDIAAFVPRKDA